MASSALHRQPPPRGGRRRRMLVVVSTGVACVAIAAGVIVGLRGDGGRAANASDGCDTPQRLTVVTAPEISRVVSSVVRATGLDSPCVTVLVSARPAAEVAASLARDDADRPGVWIPDSSAWTDGPAEPGRGLPVANVSLASSPVVFTLASRRADQFVTYADLLPANASAALPARLSLPSPQVSAATVSAVIGLQAALAGRADAPASLASALRGSLRDSDAAAPSLASLASDPTSPAVAVPEQQAWAHNVANEPRVSAVYPPPVAGTSFDYPFVVLATQASQRKTAAALLEALRGDVGRQLLDAAGFRAPDGTAGPELSAVAGLSPTAPVNASRAAPAAIAAATATLEQIPKPSRLLVVLDVSGSMAKQVPGANGARRIDLAVQAATNGLALYPDDTVAGLWVFSTAIDGRRDYRELAPMTTLGRNVSGASGREVLAEALSRVAVRRGGGTGLYDTTVSAVRTVQRGWDPDRVNSVVILTDGANDDPQGLTLAQAVQTLAAERIPGQPVYVITIGYGPEVDTAALTALSKATGAESYHAGDPRDIRKVMLEAIGRRPGRPS